MLRAEHLKKTYGNRIVVRDVSLHVDAGEIVGLLGPNGAGKTTTFLMVVGLVKPSAGRVFLGQSDITKKPIYKRAREGLGYLPQDLSIFRKLTVRQNLQAIAEVLPIGCAEREERVEQALEEFSLKHLERQPAIALSGGERRRLEIARALLIRPKILLLDEPFSGVDPISIQEVQRIILSLKERSIGVLITDHSVRETLSIVDRAYLIHDGGVLTCGNSKALLDDPLCRKFYLGDNFTLV
ncbi:MAG: LPS export ABC transporter ATP-binding protein [Puniceicoccales bacterium]|jgi:lipopolysaccharide export system ATP-binding protein|nr:LPS export ABC transporter ATP-binding protein [Puniceicoccales bacterium]